MHFFDVFQDKLIASAHVFPVSCGFRFLLSRSIPMPIDYLVLGLL